jgi:hypothetical protein
MLCGFAAGCEAVDQHPTRAARVGTPQLPRRSVRIGLGYALGSGLPFDEWMGSLFITFSVAIPCTQVGRARTKGKAQIARQADRRGVAAASHPAASRHEN